MLNKSLQIDLKLTFDVFHILNHGQSSKMYLETGEKQKVAPDIFQSGPEFSWKWPRIFLFYIDSSIS